jgi:hypothetical protein
MSDLHAIPDLFRTRRHAGRRRWRVDPVLHSLVPVACVLVTAHTLHMFNITWFDHLLVY